MKSFQQIRCQRCRAANPLGEELCAECGTRLMLVVEPTALRFEEDALTVGQQEGLVVERLSLMENNLTRFIGHLERSTELLSQQAQLVSREHMLLEALISMLSAAGVVDVKELEKLWEVNCARVAEGERQAKLRDEVRAEIMQGFKGRAAQQFARLVNEGFAAFNKKEIDDGWRLLERAAGLAPKNAPLNGLLGRQFFSTGKTSLARSYLERAFAAAPNSAVTCLLLAITRGDEHDAPGAQVLLTEAERLGLTAPFALHYARGRLLAHEGRWREALVAFKQALAARNVADAHYVVALAAFQLGHLRLAAQHVNKALALDERYVEAFNLLGLIRRGAGEQSRAREAFAQARALAPQSVAQDAGTRRAPRFTEASLRDSFFGAGEQARQLLTGGDVRLAALLRTEAQGG